MKLDQTDVTVFTKSAAVKVNYISLITTSVEIIAAQSDSSAKMINRRTSGAAPMRIKGSNESKRNETDGSTARYDLSVSRCRSFVAESDNIVID